MNWKQLVQSGFRKLGIEVHRAAQGSEYTPRPPFGYSTYSPWFEDWFQEIFAKVSSRTVCSDDRCYTLYRFCQHCRHLEGEFAECGVYKGGTAFLTASVLAEAGSSKTLHLFDTFAGMPKEADDDPSAHRQGDFGDASLQSVMDYLKPFPRVTLHAGRIPETLADVKDRKFAFVHVDVDIYQSVYDCCKFFYDRLITSGVMILDDYGFYEYKHAGKKAVDDFLRNKKEKPISLHTGQCLILKL